MIRRRSPSVRSYVSASASFFCPTCGGDRIADVCDGRRRLVLGTIAVVPWTQADAHLRCTACDSRHPTDALQVLTSAELSMRLIDLTRVLTAMTVRTGEASHRDLRTQAVRHIRTVLPGYHQNLLDADMAQLDPAAAADHVAPVADILEVEAKERLIAAMVNVALAAHTISPHQRWLLAEVGTTLGLTPIHVTGIISATAASVAPSTEDPDTCLDAEA